jgi:hypothetical protein
MVKIAKTVSIEEKVWQDFMKKVFEKYGRTSGGVVGHSLEEAIVLWLKQK